MPERSYALSAVLEVVFDKPLNCEWTASDLMRYMTGIPLPRFGRGIIRKACMVALLEWHPQLANVPAPRMAWSSRYMRRWLARQQAVLGETLVVRPLEAGRTYRSVLPDGSVHTSTLEYTNPSANSR